MRMLAVALCLVCALAVAGSGAWAAEPTGGTLSVDSARGVVMIDLRGSVLGRLTTGTLRVTDLTPNDRYAPLVVGRKLTAERIGPRTVVYRGQGVRFRLLGGGYRMVARGSGITVSAVGRGVVMLDGDPRYPGEEVGIYSQDGIDCTAEPTSCTPLPTEPERFALESPATQSRTKPTP